MDIDLLINKNKDVGLVATGKFDSPVSGIIFDHQTQSLSLEFGQTMETLDLNVPISEDFIPHIAHKNHLFLIGTDKRHIHEAYRVPLIHVNDYKDKNVEEWS
ncbi:MAG: hypothetical protein COB76_02880 [Alphaproteobacteria bacterium]|nr:MAG: hypothetical protein COB76_02880 [Alphaproteobacteria bacterium]